MCQSSWTKGQSNCLTHATDQLKKAIRRQQASSLSSGNDRVAPGVKRGDSLHLAQLIMGPLTQQRGLRGAEEGVAELGVSGVAIGDIAFQLLEFCTREIHHRAAGVVIGLPKRFLSSAHNLARRSRLARRSCVSRSSPTSIIFWSLDYSGAMRRRADEINERFKNRIGAKSAKAVRFTKLLDQTLHYEICHGGAVFYAAKAGLLARVPSPAELALPQAPQRSQGLRAARPAAARASPPPAYS